MAVTFKFYGRLREDGKGGISLELFQDFDPAQEVPTGQITVIKDMAAGPVHSIMTMAEVVESRPEKTED